MSDEKKTEHLDTPLMRQYFSIKAKYPDALLLFRVGDFYETFGEDAIKTSNILGIALTRKATGNNTFTELAGVPYHALDAYLPKLVRAGFRVAICDQLEDPKKAKKLVKRGVTELVTPGLSYNDKVLNHKTNNFLASIHLENKVAGISFLDISTGEFLVAEGTYEYIDKLIAGFKPSEIIVQKNKFKQFIEIFGEKFYTTTLDEWVFKKHYTYDLLIKHFETTSLKGFGIDSLGFGIISAGAALHYLAETQHDKLQHISSVARIEEDKYVWLDKFTIRNLELFSSINPSVNGKTFIDVIDETISPMGSRLLKRWIALPLKDRQAIDERLNIVEYLIKDTEFSENLKSYIRQIGDIERLISKVSAGRVTPRELIHIKRALFAISPIKEACIKAPLEELKKIGEQLNPCTIIRQRLEKEIMPDPPFMLNKGNVIRQGVSQELDELRKIAFSGKDYLVEIQQRESKKTGIPSLKIGFNSVFGYYFEVTNTHKNKVPTDWARKQTLTNAERYVTEELKQYEEKILDAEEKIIALETEIFNKLVYDLTDYIKPIQLNANLIAKLDCLLSFAIVAVKNNYVCPEINDDFILDIKQGRHPVIEQNLNIGEKYIPNDVYLDNERQQIIVVTGPNMSGKSALLRQTALIVLLAQIGSFVPAESAKIGLVDKIFTRVGASDNIALGESTFMVEMNETASILNNISDRSLLLLDEIGRGTSTYDGISIAWAIAEYLHDNAQGRPKTLFATHYHELNEMASHFKRIKNYNVSVKEIDGKVIFLRKLVPGGSDKSFGIHVAKMAGIPKSIVKRANEILEQLEGTNNSQSLAKPVKDLSYRKEGYQLTLFTLDDQLAEQIKEKLKDIEINNLTPIEALLKLEEIKKMLEK